MGTSSSTNSQMSSFMESIQQVMSNVISQNSSTIGNTISTTQDIKLEFKGRIWPGCKINVSNNLNLDAKFVSSIDADTSNELKTKISNELENKAQQMVKIIRGFLSGIGAKNDDTTIMNIQSRVQQIIMNNINTQQMNKVLNNIYSIQGVNVIYHGDIGSPDGKAGAICELNHDNNALIKVVSENVVKSMISSIVNDEVINRMKNDASQTVYKEEKGVDSILAGLVWVIVALIILVGIVGKQGLKAITDYKMYIVAGVGVGIAYLLKVWPFKKKQSEFWGCEKDSNGIPTGKCAEYTNDKEGPFWTKELCETAVKDPKVMVCDFWGCEVDQNTGFNTGNCARKKNINDGVYKTQKECNDTKARKCTGVWGCNVNASGFYEPGCRQYAPNDPNKPENTYPNQGQCGDASIIGCKKCFARDKDDKCQETLFVPGLCQYTSIGDCQNKKLSSESYGEYYNSEVDDEDDDEDVVDMLDNDSD
jgi:hypothetical protein